MHVVTQSSPKATGALRLPAGVATVQGHRASQEDAYFMQMRVSRSGGQAALFGVLDGHGGPRAALVAARLLAGLQAPDVRPAALTPLLRAAYAAVDARLRVALGADDQSGCTAVSAAITADNILVANAGDSRAVLVTVDGAVPLSTDHRPELPAEAARILAAGGFVHCGRVNGVLAMSRALGDYELKGVAGLPPHKQPVSPCPDVVLHHRDAGRDEWLLLASDGLWDVMSSTTAAQAVRHSAASLEAAKTEPPASDASAAAGAPAPSPPGAGPSTVCPSRIAELLVQEALMRGSRDNVTVMLVDLRAPARREAAHKLPAAAAEGACPHAPVTGAIASPATENSVPAECTKDDGRALTAPTLPEGSADASALP